VLEKPRVAPFRFVFGRDLDGQAVAASAARQWLPTYTYRPAKRTIVDRTTVRFRPES
jgi:hypothetical protein